MIVELSTQLAVGAPTAPRWPPPQGEWTYADYVRLSNNDARYEVIGGDLHMAPAPRPSHQKAIFALSGRLWEFLQRQPVGEVLTAPVDVILPGLASPVQPDLLFIGNDRLDTVKNDTIEGAPDLIVEVLSPSDPMYDRRTKFQLYARAGVREYWIVDLEAREISINVLRGQAYALLRSFGADEPIRSEVLTGFSVQVSEICPP